MYTNIIFAIDLLTEHSHLAEKAAHIAKQFKAKLYLLHVIELPASVQLAQGLGFTELASPSKEDAKTILSLVGESLSIPESQQIVEIGSIKDIVIKKARALDCQMIIIGSHSPRGIESLFEHNVHSIINHAFCDVITLKA